MGGKGSQSVNTSQTQTYTPDPNAYNSIMYALNRTQAVSQTPFQTPVAPVAGFSADQQRAFDLTNQAQGSAQPYYNTAASFMGPQGAGQFYNPMASNVMAGLQDVFGQQMKQTTGNAIQQAGGTGADRIAVAQANLAKQQGLSAGNTLAGLYGQAQTAAQNAGYGMANLGTASQNAQLSGAQALLGTGGLQQQLAQAQLNAPYQNTLQQIAWPYQNAQFLSGITAALAPGLGGTTSGTGSTTYPPASPWGTIAGLAQAGAGIAGIGSQQGWFGARGGRVRHTNPFHFASGGDVLGGLAGMGGQGGSVDDVNVDMPQVEQGTEGKPGIAEGVVSDKPIDMTPKSVVPQQQVQQINPHIPQLDLRPPQQSSGGGKGGGIGSVIGAIAPLFALARGGAAYPRRRYDDGGGVGKGSDVGGGDFSDPGIVDTGESDWGGFGGDTGGLGGFGGGFDGGFGGSNPMTLDAIRRDFGINDMMKETPNTELARAEPSRIAAATTNAPGGLGESQRYLDAAKRQLAQQMEPRQIAPPNLLTNNELPTSGSPYSVPSLTNMPSPLTTMPRAAMSPPMNAMPPQMADAALPSQLGAGVPMLQTSANGQPIELSPAQRAALYGRDLGAGTMTSAAGPQSVYHQVTGRLESSGNPYAQTGSNQGLMQFGAPEQREFGITNPWDPEQQHRALDQESARNAAVFQRKFGRAPSDAELYLMHQQGIGGGPALMDPANANRSAWEVLRPLYRNPQTALQAITGNRPGGATWAPGEVPTAGQFVDAWANRYGREEARVTGTPQQPIMTAQARQQPAPTASDDTTNPYTLQQSSAYSDTAAGPQNRVAENQATPARTASDAGPPPMPELPPDKPLERPSKRGMASTFQSPWGMLLLSGLGTMAAAGQRDAHGLPIPPLSAIGQGALAGIKQEMSIEEASKKLDFEADKANRMSPEQRYEAGLKARKQWFDEHKPQQFYGPYGMPSGSYQWNEGSGKWEPVPQPFQQPAPQQQQPQPQQQPAQQGAAGAGTTTAAPAAPYDYTTGAPTVAKGADVPEPPPSVLGRSAETFKTEAESYLLTGKPPQSVGGQKAGPQNLAYSNAVKNYANSLAASRGLTPREVAELQTERPKALQFIVSADGRATVSLGTAWRHLQTLKEYVAAWNNQASNLPALRKIQARIAQEYGSAGATNIEAATQIIGPEILKAIGVQGAGGEREREAVSAIYSASKSPEQIGGAIGVTEALIGGQIEGKERQASAVGVTTDKFKKLVGEDEYNAIKSHGAGGAKPAPAGGGAGQPPARVKQNGHTFERQPDGSYKAID